MKHFKHLLLVAVMLSGINTTFATSVSFPATEQPGNANATSATNEWSLYNNLLSASFVLNNGDLFFNGSDELQLNGGSEPFMITLGNGTVVKASEMTMTSSPKVVDLTADSNSQRASLRYGGKAITANYSYNSLSFVWRAVLRDGSHYLRTELEISASSNTQMKDITPMNYTLADNAPEVQVKGTTRGAPLASTKIFAGIENPNGINSVGASGSSAQFSISSWTPETWVATSNVPSGITSLGFSQSQIVATEGYVYISKAGNTSFTFSYTSGTHRMNLTGVDICDAYGNVVAQDYHIGYTGEAANRNSYTINVPAAGNYKLRYFGETKTETITSSGNISISGASVTQATSGSRIISGRWSRATTLKAGDTWKISSVVGLVAPGQLRRSFLAYHERERAVPYRSFIHYNSWYELNIDRNNSSNPLDRMTEAKCKPVLEAWKKNLFDVHDVGIDAFVWDDGWDDFNSLWDFHIGFPNGFSKLDEIASSMGSGIGAWLGPVGGYGSSKQQRLNYWNNTHSSQITNFELANPEYLNAFAARCSQMVNDYNFRYFKLDGISDLGNATGPKIEEDVESFLNMLNVLREIKEDLFFNCTVGTWSSPFWFHFADAVWRQDADWSSIGNQGDNREKWITYRDHMVYKNFTLAAPICPINSLMTHGLIVTKYGPPAAMPYNDSEATAKGIVREMHCAFGCGSGLIELYVDNDLMTNIGNNGELWAELAECIKWHRENEDVLADAHWVGGNPWNGYSAEVYGWASWNGKKATLTLRNPNATSRTFTTTLREALDIPSYVTGEITLTDAFKNQTQYSGITGNSIDIDQTISFNMPAFDVVVFDGDCAKDLELTGSMTVSNITNRKANIPIKSSYNHPLSQGWIQMGYLNGWDTKTALTAEDVANMFTPVGFVNGENYVSLSSNGRLNATQFSWNNFAIKSGTPIVLVVGDYSNIKEAEEIAILKVTDNSGDMCWEEADGVTLNLSADNLTPVWGEIVDVNSEKTVHTAPFTYPLGIKDTESAVSSVNITGIDNGIVVTGLNRNDAVTIYDTNGAVVAKAVASGDELKLDVATKGIYIISVANSNNLIKTEKILMK